MRTLRIVLLSLGVVGGYGMAFCAGRHHRGEREAFERHVADVCVGAANRANAAVPGAAPPNAPAPGRPPAPPAEP